MIIYQYLKLNEIELDLKIKLKDVAQFSLFHYNSNSLITLYLP